MPARSIFHSPLISLFRYHGLVVFGVAAGVIFVNDNVIEVNPVTGGSMSPTLSPDWEASGRRDYLTYSKWRPTQDLKRGDVVCFLHPYRPEDVAVKRVIGLEGDVVLLDRRRRPDGENSDTMGSRSWDAWMGRAVVPKGHVWVEGDNWRKSYDSNYYGPISRALITGRAMIVAWPQGKCGAQPWKGFESRTKVLPNAFDFNSDHDMAEMVHSRIIP